MECRYLDSSGLQVPALGCGTCTFGGEGDYFKAWGGTDVAEAVRLVDICLDAGVNMFDSAEVYSAGAAGSVLGEAIERHPRDRLLISTKSARPRLHSFDARTPVEEVRATLEQARSATASGRRE